MFFCFSENRFLKWRQFLLTVKSCLLENKINIIDLASAEFVHSVVKVTCHLFGHMKWRHDAGDCLIQVVFNTSLTAFICDFINVHVHLILFSYPVLNVTSKLYGF